MRCCEWTRSEGVDPIGTAGSYRGLLVIDWPLPWPRDVSEIPGLGELSVAAKRRGVRVQAVVPSSDSSWSVSMYRWDPSRGRYLGIQAPARVSSVETASALLAGSEPPGCHPVEATEVLICGHGRRDPCCGSLGTSLQIELQADGTLAGNAVRRTSHTGGHRFAPTAIILPEGTCWGYLDAPSLIRIVTRTGPIEDQLSRYRGCTGMSSPAVQAVERAILREIGWDLLDWPRSGHETGSDSVLFTATEPSGLTRTWRSEVATRRILPVPACGEPLSGNEKTEPELVVVGLREQDVREFA